MRTPVVAVSADVKYLESYAWHAAPDTYLLAALRVAGAMPVIVPSLGAAIDADSILCRVDGLLLTGSKSNVHPGLYGIEPAEKYEPYDADRDETSMVLIKRALQRGIPLLAICRGLQELNVALGGSIATEIQDLAGRIDHRAPAAKAQAERYALSHAVDIKSGSRLARILDAEAVHVNSLHRQAIDTIAPELEIEAQAKDGTVEAVSVRNASIFAFGVQWHPEYWAESDGPSRKIFEAFGDAVRKYMQQSGSFNEGA